MTVNTRIVSLLMRRDDVPFIPLQEGLRLQVLPSMASLPSCQKHQSAAFIQDLAILVVWDDEPKNLLLRAENIEKQLMNTVWHTPSPMLDEKANKSQSVLITEVMGSEDGVMHEDLRNPPRKIVLIQAILTAFTIILIVAALGAGWRNVAIEIAVDHNLIRMAFILVWPLQFWLAMVSLLHLFNYQTPNAYSSSCKVSWAVLRRYWVPPLRSRTIRNSIPGNHPFGWLGVIFLTSLSNVQSTKKAYALLLNPLSSR